MALSRRVHEYNSSGISAKISSHEPVLNLRQALDEYESCLSDPERKNFHAVGKPDAAAAINLTALIDRSHDNHRQQCLGTRLTIFLESMQQFSAIVDTFINSHPEVASLVWGGIKLTLLTVNNVTTYFEKLSELLMKLGSTCPRFERYGSLYPDSVEVQEALCDYYAAVIRLCRYLMDSSRKSTSKTLFRATIFPFEVEFGRFDRNLKSLSEKFMEAVNLASHEAQGVSLQVQKAIQQEQKQQGTALMAIKDNLFHKDRRDMESMMIAEKRRILGEKRLRILNIFSNHKHKSSWNQIRKDCTPGTSTWVFETDIFCSWKSGWLKRIWCCGRLGSGKSVIRSAHEIFTKTMLIGESACAIVNIMETIPSKDRTGFFFCRHDDEESLRARTIIGSIAMQFAEDLPPNAFADLEEDSVETPDIVSFLIRKLSRSCQYFVVIDGLDECDEVEATEAVRFLAKLQASPLHINVYCSTRPAMLTWLPSDFQPEKIINLEGLENHKRLAHDMNRFLWVKLQIETLRKAQSNAQLLTALKTLPQNLPQTYERILRQVVDKVNPDIAKQILRWVAVAKRPLSIEELREAIAIKPLGEARDSNHLVHNIMDAISSCGNLIFVNEEDHTAHFTHSSVKQYLISQDVHESVRGYRISLQDANEEVGTACVTYLNFSLGAVAQQQRSTGSFAELPYFVQGMSSPLGRATSKLVVHQAQRRARSNERTNRILQEVAGDTELRRQQRELEKHVFRPYAERFWLEHTKPRIDPKSSRRRWGLWCNLVDRKGWADKCFGVTWKSDEWKSRAENVLNWIVEQDHCSLAQYLAMSKQELSDDQLLILSEGAAAKNHPDLIELYVEKQQMNLKLMSVDLRNCALVVAASSGHVNTVDQLLSTRAGFYLVHKDGRTPLCAAASSGSVDVVQRLLQENLEVNDRGLQHPERTALQAAAESGHLEIVEILLDHGADVNAIAGDLDGRTALQAAAGEGHYSVVSSLLRRQAEVNAPACHSNGRTALQAAAENGHLTIITELLLGHVLEGYEKADVNAPAGNQRGRTALQAAAGKGQVFMVAFLLNEKAEINAHGSLWGGGRTALQAAAENDHLDVVEMLLTAKENADVNAAAENYQGRTALQAAAGAGHLRIIDRLIKAKADCNAEPCEAGGRTALQAAAEGGHKDAVRKLLQAGAAVNAAPSPRSGLTALQAAIRSGELDLINLFLSQEYHADVNAPAVDPNGRTALQAAAAEGHLAVVDRLLQEGADINAPICQKRGRTALQAAAEGGHLSVVDRLLQKGANINAPTCQDEGRTALQAAAGGGHLTVVGRLLQEGADVNAASGPDYGRTAIQAAAESGHEPVVRELLEAGAVVNTPLQSHGKTALRAAAEGGFEIIVRVLLKEGATDQAEKSGQTAWRAAALKGHSNIMKCLNQAGFSK